MTEVKKDSTVISERPGEVKDVIISLVKFDHDLIELLSKKLGKLERKSSGNEEYVRDRMRYNVWTIKQFADLTSKSIPTITNMTNRPVIFENGEVGVALNHCYPFPGEDHKGPRFIFRDEKSMKYLCECL